MNAVMTIVLLAVGPIVMMIPVLLLMIFARDARSAIES
jgi:hypothetical protein